MKLLAMLCLLAIAFASIGCGSGKSGSSAGGQINKIKQEEDSAN